MRGVQRECRSPSKRGRLLVSMALLVGFIAACGGDQGADSTTSATSSIPTSTSDTTPTSGSTTTVTTSPTSSTLTTSTPFQVATLADAEGMVARAIVGDATVIFRSERANSVLPAAPGSVVGAVIAASGNVVPISAERLTTIGLPAMGRTGRWVLIADGPKVEAVDPSTGEWREVVLPAPEVGGRWFLQTLGSVVLANGAFTIDESLTLTPVTRPEPAASPWANLAVWTGQEALVLATDDAAGDPSLTQPWAFNPASGSWRTLAWPSWVPRNAPWPVHAPHQFGDTQFALWTTRGALLVDARPGGFAGLYDPTHDVWTRLSLPSTPVGGPVGFPDGDIVHVLSVMPRSETGGQADLTFRAYALALATGKWTEELVPSHYKLDSGLVPETRLIGSHVMLGAPIQGPGGGGPVLVLDLDRTPYVWRAPTNDDQATWVAYTPVGEGAAIVPYSSLVP